MNSPLPANSDQYGISAPSDEGIYQAELSENSRRKRRSPWAQGIFVLLFAFGVAVPVLIYLLPSERAKWQIAAAQAKWLDDDLAGAIQILEVAAEEFPDNPAILRQRIHFLLEAKDYEKALTDVQRLHSSTPRSRSVLSMQSYVLMHLGRQDEAIDVCKDLLQLAEDENQIGPRIDALNQLAYFQAFCDTELDTASEHMSEVLRLHGDHADRLLKQRKPFSPDDQELARSHAEFIDTNGYVQFRLGKNDIARREFENAVALFEKLSLQQKAGSLSSVRSYGLEQLIRSNDKTLAVLLYHRSLVYDRLGMRDEAKVDRERVRGLGYEPNEQLF